MTTGKSDGRIILLVTQQVGHQKTTVHLIMKKDTKGYSVLYYGNADHFINFIF